MRCLTFHCKIRPHLKLEQCFKIFCVLWKLEGEFLNSYIVGNLQIDKERPKPMFLFRDMKSTNYTGTLHNILRQNAKYAPRTEIENEKENGAEK